MPSASEQHPAAQPSWRDAEPAQPSWRESAPRDDYAQGPAAHGSTPAHLSTFASQDHETRGAEQQGPAPVAHLNADHQRHQATPNVSGTPHATEPAALPAHRATPLPPGQAQPVVPPRPAREHHAPAQQVIPPRPQHENTVAREAAAPQPAPIQVQVKAPNGHELDAPVTAQPQIAVDPEPLTDTHMQVHALPHAESTDGIPPTVQPQEQESITAHAQDAEQREQREQAAREQAEREQREQAEREQREQAAREQAEREQREQAEREQREQAAREQAAREQAAREQAEREQREQAAREQAAREQREQAAREQAAREQAEREQREQAAREQAAREQREQAAREQAQSTLPPRPLPQAVIPPRPQAQPQPYVEDRAPEQPQHYQPTAPMRPQPSEQQQVGHRAPEGRDTNQSSADGSFGSMMGRQRTPSFQPNTFDPTAAAQPEPAPLPLPTPQRQNDERGLDTLESMIEENRDERRGGFLSNLGVGGYIRRRSSNEQRQLDAQERIEQPLHRSVHNLPTYYVMVWCQKGGVGKTTTAAGIAQALAHYRQDQVAVVDTNPDGGSLAVKLGQTTPHTILDLREAVMNKVTASRLTPAIVAEYFSKHRGGLYSLALPPGKKLNRDEELTAADFYIITKCLEHYLPFKIVMIDCGTNPSSAVMPAILKAADQLVVITSTKPDEASVAVGGLEALRTSKYGYLVDRALTVVVDKDDPDSLNKAKIAQQEGESRAEHRDRIRALRDRHSRDEQDILAFFEKETDSVLRVPYDPVVSNEPKLNLDQLGPETKTAYMEAAAAIVTRLAEQHPPRR